MWFSTWICRWLCYGVLCYEMLYSLFEHRHIHMPNRSYLIVSYLNIIHITNIKRYSLLEESFHEIYLYSYSSHYCDGYFYFSLSHYYYKVTILLLVYSFCLLYWSLLLWTQKSICTSVASLCSFLRTTSEALFKQKTCTLTQCQH